MDTTFDSTFRQLLEEQQAAVLEVIHVSYSELLSASSRADRDKVLLYSIVGILIGTGNSAINLISIPSNIPAWGLGLGILVIIAYFSVSFYIGLRGDRQRLGAATSVKSAYATMKLNNLMNEVTSGVKPETIDLKWIESQALLATQRTQEVHNLQEDRNISDEVKFLKRHDIYDEYKTKGFDEPTEAQINDLKERISYKTLVKEASIQNERLLRAPIKYGNMSAILAYTPLAVSLFSMLFVLASLLSVFLPSS